MNKTKIEYLDYTCNPITGCTGEGCAVRKNCWAMSMAKRLAGRYGYPKTEPFKPTFHKDKLDAPLKVKKPSLVGLCFMGDFFDKLVQPSWQTQVYDMVFEAYWHNFLTLTKQPQNISHAVDFYSNFWIGTSINSVADLWRIDALREIDVSIRAISFEPLLEELGKIDLEGIGWVIIGAQSRPNLQPDAEWVYSLSHQASALDIPVFWKSNLTVTHGKRQEYPKRYNK